MNITFKQGIIKYPSSNNLQNFLQTSNNGVNLNTNNESILITFTHGSSNYTFEEFNNISDAWLHNFEVTSEYWLYWDIDTISGIRSFGFTEIMPTISATKPSSPITDQHWFDLGSNKMYVFETSVWRPVIRVFAAYYDSLNFFSMGGGLANYSFAGSQIGINNINDVSGKILYFDNKPILTKTKELFTTESIFNINGSNIDSLRLESSYNIVKANETLPKYHVVKYVAEDTVELANYSDSNQLIGIITEDTIINDLTNIILDGVIINTSWNWTESIGTKLWINANGELISSDPHLIDNILNPIQYNPIAKILSSNSIILRQTY